MSEEDLTPMQNALYEAYEIVVEAFGMFDKTSGPRGAHYITATDNVFAEQGLMCANCVYYEGGQKCEIVEGQIDPMAVCKLWIIPEHLIDPMHKDASQSAVAKATFTPPESVRTEARRALKWIDEGHAGDGFTAVGRKRASDLARGAAVSIDTIRRMRSYLARHEVDKQGEGWGPSQKGYPSPGRVAWAAWGGDPAKSWVNGIVADMEKAAAQTFGSRAQAGRYAAQVRWGRSRETTPTADSAAAANAIAQGQPVTIMASDIPATMDILGRTQGDPDLFNLKIADNGVQLGDARGTTARKDLPQAPGARKQEFVDAMTNRGLRVDREDVDPTTLKATQNQLSGTKVGQMYGRASSGVALPSSDRDRMIISKDNYVLDGHHRWATGVLMSRRGPQTVPVFRMNATRDDALNIMRAWNASAGIKPLDVGESNPNTMFKAGFYKAIDEAIVKSEGIDND